mmetsp:Transcript_38385/g.96484  ORF Transcript_38385/g.96484 Transcript_38385/m.96484 type:complete len:297 (+) Transcript_38385:979-1869(+)
MVYASAWQDTQPMLLVHTCCSDAITPPVERLKSKYKDGRVHKYRYEVEQRESHATYRQHFNAVDINNKLSVGPHSVATGWGPRSAVLRFWLYTAAVAESNAYLCYTSFTNNKDMTRHEWKCAMADALVAEGRAEMMGSASGLHSTAAVQLPAAQRALIAVLLVPLILRQVTDPLECPARLMRAGAQKAPSAQLRCTPLPTLRTPPASSRMAKNAPSVGSVWNAAATWSVAFALTAAPLCAHPSAPAHASPGMLQPTCRRMDGPRLDPPTLPPSTPTVYWTCKLIPLCNPIFLGIDG